MKVVVLSMNVRARLRPGDGPSLAELPRRSDSGRAARFPPSNRIFMNVCHVSICYDLICIPVPPVLSVCNRGHHSFSVTPRLWGYLFCLRPQAAR